MPARNESTRLPQSLTRLASYQRRSGRRLELIVVDDHSSDATRAVAHRLATDHLRPRVVSVAGGYGPGAAMRTGLADAKAPRILLCDADAPVPFEQISALDAALDAGADLAAGSRLTEPRALRRWDRRAMAWGFRALVRCLSPAPIRDTQCGFKLLRRELAQAIVSELVIDSFVFHVELVVRAAAQGYRVVEVGVPWREVSGSSIRPMRDSLQMFRALLRLRRELAER